MDAGPFIQLLNSQSHVEFVKLLDQKLQELNFKLVLKDLGPAVFDQEADQHAAALAFLMQCLLYCQQHVGELSAGIKHLLLELIPAASAQAARKDVKTTAVRLFHAYCTPQDAKLAAKVATIFKLSRDDLTDWPQVTQAVQQMLASQSSYKAAVHLLMHFEGLDEHVDKVEVITQLVTDGQENLAQQWVATLGKDYQITFVEACVALDRLKPAAQAVRALGLAAEFPNIEALYKQRSLARLVGKRLWQVALSFVGNDTALQTQLVRDMADEGELALAEEYRKQLGLPKSVLVVDPAAILAQEAARREQYMQLDLPEGGLLFVDSEAGLAQATQLLGGCEVLGLDVEWKPSHTAGVASPAAVLQLATRHSAVLFDLITLASSHPAALDACLCPLFSSSDVLKLGFELHGDLSKLAGSWPAVAAFRAVAGVLDLRPLWIAYGLATRRQGASVRLLSAVGLSTLCNTLLGKPLDKSQQMSDWTARPLTQRQMHYAALDAFVLPRLFDKLCQELGEAKSQQLLRQHTTTFNRQAAATLPINNAAAAGGGDSVPAASAAVLQPLTELDYFGGSSSNSSNEDTGSSSGSDQAPATSTIAATAAVGSADIDGGPARGVSDAAAASQTGEARVLAFLRHRGFDDCFKRLDSKRPQGFVLTACETASALSAPRAAVAKTMAVLVEQEPLLVVTRGDQRVDMHKLAALLGVRRRAIKLAPDNIVKELTGFAPGGGIPPIGQDGSIRVLVDYRLQQAATVAVQQTVPCCATDQDKTPAEPTNGNLKQQQQEQQELSQATSRPAAGGWPVVAAVAVQQEGSTYALDIAATASSVGGGGSNSICSGGAPCVIREGGTAAAARAASNGSSASSLFLQCGGNAVIQVSYQQLLDLSGGSVADVADVPATTAAATAAAIHIAGALGSTLTAQQPGSHPHLSRGQQAVPCFLLDSMLGRLCRWLRALGVDAEFVETGSKQQLQQAARSEGQQQQLQSLERQQQNQLIETIHNTALQEGRLFLTRDSKLAARRDVGGSVYLLNTDDAAEQLAEISRHFGIQFDQNTAMSRCSCCNAAAFQRISCEAAAKLVPARVMEVVDEFWQCGRCGKVFWMGPKSYAAINLLEGLFTDGARRSTPLQSMRPGYATPPSDGTDGEAGEDHRASSMV